MDTVQSYQCPCCGAALEFSGAKQTLHCASCGNDFSPETLEQLQSAEQNTPSSNYDWADYEARSFSEEEKTTLSGYTCPSCGAEITGDDTMGATVCPYCGNATIIPAQFSGSLRPDYLIPFQIEKKDAIALLEADMKKKPFLPDAFRSKKKIAEMSGIYIPFWMFDCDCNASVRYSAETVSHWEDSKYEYTKVDHFRLYRSGSVGFANLPVDGSEKTDNTYMESIEPFDYSKAVDFNTAYLAGYLADKYDVSAEDSIPRANERVRNSTEAAFLSTTSGYTSVVPEETNVSFTNGKIRYALLPVWMLNVQYNGQNYPFAINGQTGKIAGAYPVDKKKKWLSFAKASGISYLIITAILWLLTR